MKRKGLTVFLALVILAIYWPLSKYWYVQDDWGSLHQFMFESPRTILAATFRLDGQTFYRPFGVLYNWGIYSVFGLNAGGFHALALGWMFAAGYLVMLIARELTKDELVSWGAAFIYVSASSIHLDTQLWLVGSFELGAVTFSLASILTFMRGRYVCSAGLFLLALGFKESAIVTLPTIALFHFLRWRTK
jgi:hypothetical protein